MTIDRMRRDSISFAGQEHSGGSVADGALSRTDSYLAGKGIHEAVEISPSPTSRRFIRLGCWIALTDALAVEAAIMLTRFIRFGFRPAGPNFMTILVVTP